MEVQEGQALSSRSARFGIASIEDRVKIVVGALEGSRFLKTPMSTLFQRPTPVGEIAE